jgi:hypothetical protein
VIPRVETPARIAINGDALSSAESVILHCLVRTYQVDRIYNLNVYVNLALNLQLDVGSL